MTATYHWLFAVKVFSALGCGLIAGVFFAFSSFVMSALARLPPAQGIAAMQSINITVINPLFMGVFMGTAVACMFLTVFSLFHRQQPGAVFLLVGSLLYLGGTFLVTIIWNVPLNDALATVEPHSAQGASLWAHYLDSWTTGNHVRAVAALAASALLTLSLCQRTAQ